MFFFTPGERRVFRRRENLSTAQWAARYRVVTNGPMPGRWRNDAVPYAVEPMETLDLPHVRRVILMWAPQTAKTQVAFNFLGRRIDQEPGSCMYVGPDEKVTKRISRKRMIPFLKRTPRLAELLGEGISETTTLAVQFINGADLLLAWATSAAEISSESIEVLIRDELDKWPAYAGREADPIALTDVRTNAYPYTKKILDISTPADESKYIGKEVENEADELRRYWAACPVCGEAQIMHFGQFDWPKNIKEPRKIVRDRLASYQCETCGMHWDDHMRDMAVRKGFWKADDPVERPQVVAFHLPSWYSPSVSLSSVVAAYLRGLEDPAKLMVFITQHKAETWKETVAPKKEDKILEHRTDLPPLIVPAEAVALTCGIDVQKFGFWFVVRAWAEDLTSWLIQYGFLTDLAAVETLLFQTAYRIQNSQNTMEIWRAAMDTGGGLTEENIWTRTEEIYQWLRENGRGRVFGTKGASRPQLQRIRVTVIDKLPRSNIVIPGGLELRLIDAAAFKELIHFRLERGLEPVLDAIGVKTGECPQSQRFFLHAETGQDYASQLLAEELCKDRRGRKYWKRVRTANHLLDAECLAAACADSSWLPSLKMLAAWLKSEQEPAATPETKLLTPPKVAKSNWMNQ
jgi:phage terminase large subunit GpA-like protein